MQPNVVSLHRLCGEECPRWLEVILGSGQDRSAASGAFAFAATQSGQQDSSNKGGAMLDKTISGASYGAPPSGWLAACSRRSHLFRSRVVQLAERLA